MTNSTRYFTLYWIQTEFSFSETIMLELVNHVTPYRRFLVSLEWGRLIPMAICCYRSAQNTSWSIQHLQTSLQEFLGAPEVQALAPHWLYHYATAWSAKLSEQMRGANCSTDHVMIKSTIKVRVRQTMSKDKMSIRNLATNTIKIKKDLDLHALLNNRLVEIPVGIIGEKWNIFKSLNSVLQ